MISWPLSTVCAFYSSFAIFISVPRNGMKLTFWRNILGPSVFGTDQPASSSSNHRSRHNPATSSKTVHEVQEHGLEKGLKIVNTASILPKETSNLVVS